jgi:hypothetical protein
VVDFEDLARNARHGTRARYKSGCACTACREANATYHRDLRERKRERRRAVTPISPPTDATYGSSPEEAWDEPAEPAVTTEQLLAAVRLTRGTWAPLRLGRGRTAAAPRKVPPSAAPRPVARSYELRLACGHTDRAAIPPGAAPGHWSIACTACSTAASTAVMRTVVAVLGPA